MIAKQLLVRQVVLLGVSLLSNWGDSRTFRCHSLAIHLGQIRGEDPIGEHKCAIIIFLSPSSKISVKLQLVDRLFKISGVDNSYDNFLTETPMSFYRKVMEVLKRFW